MVLVCLFVGSDSCGIALEAVCGPPYLGNVSRHPSMLLHQHVGLDSKWPLPLLRVGNL